MKKSIMRAGVQGSGIAGMWRWTILCGTISATAFILMCFLAWWPHRRLSGRFWSFTASTFPYRPRTPSSPGHTPPCHRESWHHDSFRQNWCTLTWRSYWQKTCKSTAGILHVPSFLWSVCTDAELPLCFFRARGSRRNRSARLLWLRKCLRLRFRVQKVLSGISGILGFASARGV